MTGHRQLAAIMFTDIVGYTALMGENEEKAFALLQKNRQIQKPNIEKYGGKWLKEMGDGVLASFSTVSDAVYCAVSIQEECKNEADLKLRIGIHLGEVVFEEDDVFGDGVNIASRLEALAPSGGIWVSESVSRNIQNKQGIETEFIREEMLKNVKDPVRIYEVNVIGELPVREEQTIEDGQHPSRQPRDFNPLSGVVATIGVIVILVLAYFLYQSYFKEEQTNRTGDPEIVDKSIAVLPFKNFSEEPEKSQHICDGVMEAVRNHLSGIQDLKVTPRTSVEQYRSTKESSIQIGSNLNVLYLLMGSVQRISDQLQINVELVNVKEDQVIWSNSYHDDIANIFQTQSDIAKLVAEELKIRITPDQQHRMNIIPTTNLDAWDEYLKGESAYLKMVFNPEQGDYIQTTGFYKSALTLDSNLADAYTGLAKSYWHENYNRTSELISRNYMDSVKILCEKAIEINPNSVEAHWLLGGYYFNRDQKKYGQELFAKSLKFDPNNTRIMFGYGWNFMNMEPPRYRIAFRQMLHAVESDPQSIWLSNMYTQLASAFINIGAYEKSHEYALKALRLSNNPVDSAEALTRMTHSNLVQGNGEEALKYAEAWFKIDSVAASHHLGDIYCYLLYQCEKGEQFYINLQLNSPDKFNFRQRLAVAMWINGKKEEAMKIIRQQIRDFEAVQKLGRGWASGFDLAGLYAFTGQKEKAYQILKIINENKSWRFGLHSYLLIDPLFESLWKELEFQQIVDQAHKQIAEIREEILAMEGI